MLCRLCLKPVRCLTQLEKRLLHFAPHCQSIGEAAALSGMKVGMFSNGVQSVYKPRPWRKTRVADFCHGRPGLRIVHLARFLPPPLPQNVLDLGQTGPPRWECCLQQSCPPHCTMLLWLRNFKHLQPMCRTVASWILIESSLTKARGGLRG